MIKKTLLTAGMLLLLIGFTLTIGCTKAATGPGYTPSPGGVGPGGMMGPGGIINPEGSLIGPGGPYRAGAPRLTMSQAVNIAQAYLQKRNDPNLYLNEIMDFQYNFYVQIFEENTDIGAFEVLIDPYTGDIYPEPGPNMVWNTKYGTMSGIIWGINEAGPMTVSKTEAQADAQQFLNSYLPGSSIDTINGFYGYYTMDILMNDAIYGMVSVSGYTGQVWFHSWHGQFITQQEF
jgi:hypothetical protein